MVPARPHNLPAMSDYADRLGEAMQLERMDVTALAKGLRVSYQAVKKVIDGRTHRCARAFSRRGLNYS